MTYKYRFIRQDVYEKGRASKLKAGRTVDRMVRLFKYPLWIIVIIFFVAIGVLFVAMATGFHTMWMLFSAITIIIISTLIEVLPEEYLYNIPEREKELDDKKQYYKEYVEVIHEILIKHDINTTEKVKKLKTECELILKAREDNFSKMSSKITDMFMWVPLAALIANIIHKNNGTAVESITALIFVGFIVSQSIKLIKWISHYSEGNFKDAYLLAAINELEYSDVF